MEVMFKSSSSDQAPVVKEEKGVESDNEDVGKDGNSRKVHEEDSLKPESPKRKNVITITQEDQLESARAKMCAVREENEQLKMLLARITKDHQSLQMHFFDIVQQDKKLAQTNSAEDAEEPHDLVFLSLGRRCSDTRKELKTSNLSKSKEDDGLKGGLVLGLNSKFEASSSYGTKESWSKNETREHCPLTEILKKMRSEEDEATPQIHSKKTRVSVRARSDAPMINDGCQWRKYGQKISKGNPCPRAYYRCTVGPTCPVRKQVQRCVEDMSVLITTYEGTHNHPLSVSATAMASTTSAAACMQLSGSTSSYQVPGPSAINTSGNIHSLNFNLLENYRPRQFYSPLASFSPLSSRPTITLDLTAPPTSSPLLKPSQLNRFTPTSINFCTPDPSRSVCGDQSYDQNTMGAVNMGRQNQGRQNQGYLPCVPTSNPPPQQSLSMDTINAAATKVIASDPSFQTALQAAISSIVGGGVDGMHGSQDGEKNKIGKILKWGEYFPLNSTYSSSSTINCNASSSSSSKQKEGSLVCLPPASLPFSSTKNVPEFPVDNKDYMS